MKQIKQQAGFTLIELIMVIVILGVLSAFALPRFADLGGEARKASIQGLAGAIKSAANIAHAKALVAGGAEGDAVTLEGQAITMSNFYPTATAAGITLAAQVDTDYTATYNATATTATYTVSGATTAVNCQVVYTAATASAVPDIAVDVSDC